MVAHPELSLLLLLAIAALVAVLANRARLPYAVGLVLAGLVLGNLVHYSGPHLSKELLFAVVLPGLLFEAAYQMHFAEFWRARLSILTLAVPGLIVATVLTAAIAWWGINRIAPGSLLWIEALVFGALISATDPISVLAIFRTLGVDRRLAVIVEAESLFNDGTAIVVFGIVLAMATGHPLGAGGAALEFLRVAGLAAVVGAIVGGAVGTLTRAQDDAMAGIALTVLGGYGSFIAAELLGLSGVIACVVAGLITGTWGAQGRMGAATRGAIDAFWSYAAYLLNSCVFLLMGVEINLAKLALYLPQIAIAWVAINVARAAFVYAKYALMRAGGGAAWPLSWATVLTWGGLRGGLSMVLALSLPGEFPHRDLVLHMTFGVVLLTLLVQGLTIKPLLRRLQLASERSSG
ncbi:MAG TPA: sodium:proton antiporter [Steroidobacteraceae bacterium]|nr:sodium:proton antiporter [Steroidobacteraceae bacterium]